MVQHGYWWWWWVLWWCVVVACCGGEGVDALKCYNCNNCNKYELSQSQGCDSDLTHCMKLHMETGQVQRRCGTQRMCTNSKTELKTKYKEVFCCDTDNCNSAPASHSGSLLPLLLLALLPPTLAAAARRLLLLHC